MRLTAGKASPLRAIVLVALVLASTAATCLPAVPSATRQARLDPIVYTLRAPEPATHVAEVTAVVPTSGHASIEMMLPVWSPGYYEVENYAGNVHDLGAHTPDGTALQVQQPTGNRWRIETKSSPTVVLTYRITCDRGFVTANYVGEDLWTLNGAPSFMTLVEKAKRPHEVHLELPAGWSAMTSLDPAPDGMPNHWLAADFDELVDSPIAAGELSVHTFTVAGTPHYLVDMGEVGDFDGAAAARDLQRIVQQTCRFWADLPYKRYVFLNIFRRGGGGLEHKSSTMLTSSLDRTQTPEAYLGWLAFVSHEYFHAFNVKRLRPVELGPFDYENPPSTSSLWISEGLTSYFGGLMVTRSGLGSPEHYLSALSGHIRQLQTSPGRLLQTLNQSSLDVWSGGGSGVGQDPETRISYYVKGPVVGFVLDARIQRLTDGRKGLGDVMRLAYQRYGGERGFTPEQFQETAEEVTGANLNTFFQRTLASTEELDYQEALDWFGLRFAAVTSDDPAAVWRLEVRPDATPEQRSHWEAQVAERNP